METACADTDYKQPVFSLEFNIYGTGAEIRLNDIIIYRHKSQGKVLSQKPIPESIIDGENILTVSSFPLKKNNYEYLQGAYIEAVISVREKNSSLNDSQIILQLKLNPLNIEGKLLENTLSEYGDKEAIIVVHNEKQIVAERRTNIKSPFPRWAWQDGQVIENTTENLNSLFEVYKETWNALDSGDMDKIRELYDPAAQEFAWAYHYQDKKHGHRIMNTGGLVNDNDWGLADINLLINKRKYEIDIYANGRIAQIIELTKSKRSPIVYYNKNVKMLNIQKFGFYKNQQGEWIMIR